MKRSFQFVGIVIAALLVVQPALAGGLCFTAPDSQQMTASDCCAVSDSASSPHGAVALHAPGHAIVSTVPDTQLESDCGEGCCSVAPQRAPQPSATEKTTAVRAQIVNMQAVPVADIPPQAVRSIYPHVTAPARHVLLNVFRI
jgi:hypothetical protein